MRLPPTGNMLRGYPDDLDQHHAKLGGHRARASIFKVEARQIDPNCQKLKTIPRQLLLEWTVAAALLPQPFVQQTSAGSRGHPTDPSLFSRCLKRRPLNAITVAGRARHNNVLSKSWPEAKRRPRPTIRTRSPFR